MSLHRSLRFRTFLLVLACTVAFPSASALAESTEAFPVQLVRVSVPAQADRDRLTTLGLDLTEHGGDGYVEVVLHSSADATKLATEGFSWTVTIPDLGLRELQNNRVNAAYASAVQVSPLPSGRDAYRTLADYNADLRALASGNPGLVRLVTLSRRTLEGREILGVEISRNVTSTTDGKPTFLMMGLHSSASRRACTPGTSRAPPAAPTPRRSSTC